MDFLEIHGEGVGSKNMGKRVIKKEEHIILH
jgi:hypothetical protein